MRRAPSARDSQPEADDGAALRDLSEPDPDLFGLRFERLIGPV
jgi:hypothetical protein